MAVKLLRSGLTTGKTYHDWLRVADMFGEIGSAMVPALLILQMGLLATPLGKLLVALVVIALVLILGRLVMNLAWRLLKIAIIIVGLLWLVSVVIPSIGL